MVVTLMISGVNQTEVAIEIVYVYDECYNCINDIGVHVHACMGINHAYIIANIAVIRTVCQ